MEEINPSRDYDFPYKPYNIQLQLMNTIYDSLEKNKISIIESPTGTGKSLSIICSVLKWISDYKEKQLDYLTNSIEKLKLELNSCERESSDWVFNQLKGISTNNNIKDLNLVLTKFKKHNDYCNELKKRSKYQKNKKELLSNKRMLETTDTDEDDLIIQYIEDDSHEKVEEENESFYNPKIYYCSRTHSQLSQFINEIKKTNRYKNNDSAIMLLPLSSRLNYCINPNVNRFDNVNIINEKCNELQNSKQKCSMCKYSLLEELREDILTTAQDIEEIVSKGKQIKACPYYASRLAVSEAEIVVLPYNTLLHKATRESFGIKLTDSIVIVDEAHNLLETISSIHSIEIKSNQINSLLKYVSLYMTKYYTKFNSLNLMYLKQLIFILKKCLHILNTSKGENISFQPLDFVLKMNIENINVYQLVKFIDKSRIASKLHMFSIKSNSDNIISQSTKKQKSLGTLAFLDKIKTNSSKVSKQENEKVPDQDKSSKISQLEKEECFNSNTLYTFKDFLLSLKDYQTSGKILVNINDKDPNGSSIKYILLNPSSHFKDIILECRSLVLCGGTMKPFGDYVNQLFKPLNISDDRILTFSCGHVISPSNLLAAGCSNGPTNIPLSYTFSKRSTPELVRETGQAIVELCRVIPKGVVIFFPSYEYEEFILKQWQIMGILSNIEKCKKRIFKEPKKSSLVPNVLQCYTRYIKSSKENGAVIFSVIGGKMSEGINFSDDLGRGVIVIGLPYPNKNSLELMEKMSYLDSLGNNLGNEYYENVCMRAVNQSIGRAIRHQNDYSAIVLLDQRYHTKQNKLSDWIRTRFQNINQFSLVTSQIKQFFENK